MYLLPVVCSSSLSPAANSSLKTINRPAQQRNNRSRVLLNRALNQLAPACMVPRSVPLRPNLRKVSLNNKIHKPRRDRTIRFSPRKDNNLPLPARCVPSRAISPFASRRMARSANLVSISQALVSLAAPLVPQR